MATQITITGKTTVGGAASTITLTNAPPIKSILAGELIVNSHAHAIGTIAFTGNALATHTHDMRIIGGQGAAGTNTVTCPAATDLLGKQEAGDADVLGVNAATVGGVMVITAGTPAGTMAGSAAAGKPARAALILATTTPANNLEILRTGKATFSLYLTTALTADDVIVLSVEEEGVIVRP